MNVTYYINTGTPGSISGHNGISGATIQDAIADFKAYIADCDRFGNYYQNASLDITCDSWPSYRTYTLGPRGGLVKNQEW